MTDTVHSDFMWRLMRELYPICRSITGEGARNSAPLGPPFAGLSFRAAWALVRGLGLKPRNQ